MRTQQLMANCNVITTDAGQFLQSYNSFIAAKMNDGSVKLDPIFWDYSATTRKHRNLFFGEDIKTIKNKIATGEYQFENLNQ